MKLNIREVTGQDAITTEDGQTVFDAIKPELDSHRTVELDFEGVEVFASPFFNAAIGQLLSDFRREYLREHLQIMNLEEMGSDLMARVIANSERYYSSPNYREAQMQVLDEMAKEA